MNTHLRTMVAVALLAALVPAQTKDGAAALARAKVIEEQEGDLKAAEAAYRALLNDAAASAVHGETALRLGAMLWRLDKKDDGKPFLERAVAAGGDVAAQATLVLQGQGEAGKQAQERLEKARALVLRIQDQSWKPRDKNGQLDEAVMLAVRDLKWLGEAAVQAQVERLDSLLGVEDAQLHTGIGEPVPDVALFVHTLWEMGTEPTQQFFARSATEGTVGWRRFVTKHADGVAPDLMPALVRFLHDPDPTGEVQRNLDRILWSVPVPTLVELTKDAHAGARAAGFTGLGDVWPNLPPAEQVRILELVDAPLRRALRDAEGRPAHAASRLVSRFAVYGPRAARRIVLTEVARFPDGRGTLVPDQKNMSWPLDDAEMDLLLASCRTLGALPSQPLAPSSDARRALLGLFSRHQPEWSARSVDAVLELLELGYGGDESTESNWLASFFALIEPGQLERFVRALPQLARANQAFQFLATRDLPPGLFPALRDVVDAGLRAPPRNWDFFKKGRSGGPEPSYELGQLLWNAGRTGAPEAAPWLSEFADRVPGSDLEVARALLELARTSDGEPVRAGLRKLLVAPGATDIRSNLFAELARLGDEPSIALFPRAYALGLRGHTPSAPSLGRPSQRPPNRQNPQDMQAKGIGFLGLKPGSRKQQGHAWHGYSDAQLVQAWSTLLACDARDEVWAEIQTMQDRVPVQVLPILAAELPAAWAELPPDQRNNTLSPVFQALWRVPTDQLATGTTLRTTIEGLLRAEDVELAVNTFASLEPKVALTFGEEAPGLLRRATSPGTFALSLQRAGIELRTEDWRLALRDKSYRTYTLSALPAPLDPILQQDVEALLRDDPSEEGRVVAANTLARLLAMDSVAPLLEALRDPSAKVRDAAKEALERLRFQREQQAFWANAKAGIDTSPSSAAAKLLAQAKPGETKDQRLLAIRSLAALGAPESLPYLIDWTKDADAEIAAAARGAVAKIHETAGAKK